MNEDDSVDQKASFSGKGGVLSQSRLGAFLNWLGDPFTVIALHARLIYAWTGENSFFFGKEVLYLKGCTVQA